RSSRQSKKEHVDRNDVIENLIIFSSERDHRRANALEDDCYRWHTRSRIKLADGFKEDAVTRHGVVNSRSRQNALAEEPKRRNRDPGCNQLRTALAESMAHHFRSGDICAREVRHP